MVAAFITTRMNGASNAWTGGRGLKRETKGRRTGWGDEEADEQKRRICLWAPGRICPVAGPWVHTYTAFFVISLGTTSFNFFMTKINVFDILWVFRICIYKLIAHNCLRFCQPARICLQTWWRQSQRIFNKLISLIILILISARVIMLHYYHLLNVSL